MKKRLFAMVLAVLMLISVLSGCKNQQEAETQAAETQAAETQAAETQAAAAEDVPQEMVTLDVLTAFPAQQTAFESAGDSPVYQKVKEMTNTELNVIGLDNDQLQIRIAGDDLGDILIINSSTVLANLIESDLIMPLNDAVNQYQPQIITDAPLRWEAAEKLYGNDEGLVYCLPTNAGSEGHNYRVGRNLYTVRWDLYEKAGYPEVKTPEQLIDALKKMIELEPVNDDGKTVYGASFYTEDTNDQGLTNWTASTFGYKNLKNWVVFRNVKTDELIYDFIHEDGPYWLAMDYYYKAHKAGILDPDCFTQKLADFNERNKTGELICSPVSMDPGYEPAQLEKDPNSVKGFYTIPVEGCMMYTNLTSPQGWGCAYGIVIPKSCKDVEAALRLIGYLFSYDGSRTCLSGLEDIHWTYVDGVPTYTEETLKMIKEQGDDYVKSGIYNLFFQPLVGFTDAEPCPDGYPVNLQKGDAFLAAKDYSPAAKAYSDYFGVAYPYKALEGVYYDLSSIKTPMRGINAYDEDIDRIDAACLKLAQQAAPRLIMAGSDEEFNTLKAETIEALKAAGAEEAEAFYLDVWNAQE